MDEKQDFFMVCFMTLKCGSDISFINSFLSTSFWMLSMFNYDSEREQYCDTK